MDFKTKTGLAFIICHIFLLIWAFVCKSLGGYEFEEFTTLVGFLIPMLAVYSTAIVKDIVKNAQNPKKELTTYSPAYKFLVKFICIIFFVSLFTVVGLKGFNAGFRDFEELKITIGLLEAVFGGYIAQLIFAIYKPVKSRPATPNKSGPAPVNVNQAD